MSDINLHPFCGNDPSRPKLHQPFSKDEWTYASNGHIMVRVPWRPAVPERDDTPNAAKVFADAQDDGHFIPLPPVTIPEDDDGEECEFCSGRGTLHDCPTCSCTCRRCNGTGRPIRGEGISVGIGPACIRAQYYLLLQSFPGVELTLPEKRETPIRFRFQGGEGLLTQLFGQSFHHIEAEASALTHGKREDQS